ncbi:TPA: cell division protein SepF [Candidatus Woesearchaeota archaeon]|nr:cell division protein SepF [Candidatus Woesearchaeota archaeon]
MAGFLSQLKTKFGKVVGGEEDSSSDASSEYVELGPETQVEGSSKIVVRPFVLETFEDIKGILDSLREGYTIALVNIRPLKDKDLVELKRAVNKLKKTTDAIEGDIAGFGDDWVVVTPSFASIYRNKETTDVKEDASAKQEQHVQEY